MRRQNKTKSEFTDVDVVVIVVVYCVGPIQWAVLSFFFIICNVLDRCVI